MGGYIAYVFYDFSLLGRTILALSSYMAFHVNLGLFCLWLLLWGGLDSFSVVSYTEYIFYEEKDRQRHHPPRTTPLPKEKQKLPCRSLLQQETTQASKRHQGFCLLRDCSGLADRRVAVESGRIA